MVIKEEEYLKNLENSIGRGEVAGGIFYYNDCITVVKKNGENYIAKKINASFKDDKKVVVRKMIGQDSYTVLYKTKVPAVLVECGFITNEDDAKKLTDSMWQKKFAKSLANGIDKYFGK